MKKITILLLFISIAIMIGGCAKDPLAKTFVETDGVLSYTDTKTSPFEDSGLLISIEKGEKPYAKFVKTDLTGRETADYYLFDYANNEVEKYYYVSAMGTGFYYYYDLEQEELVRLEGDDHTDSTQSAKDAGRWESASENTSMEVKVLEAYFIDKYGISIKEAVKSN
ncbi:hypothetical protein GC105_03960 [Alkalibaculum sp. M08DMB]|uniref:Lipoprotein n=2 Tax=Alkalibaculum sporogenes TaxID=2655001 RepID=A0A6A7K6C7_9FIRM|nr:hypothetical protein [Alkalibaculum sporogenes]